MPIFGWIRGGPMWDLVPSWKSLSSLLLRGPILLIAEESVKLKVLGRC
jgi:hypothetical protein